MTVSVDRIEFLNKIRSYKDLKMSGYIMSAKGSTITVKIECHQKSDNEDDQHWHKIGGAIFIFVARNSVT